MEPNAQSALREMGLAPPESVAAIAAEALLRRDAPEFLINHSIRSYSWAVALAEVDGVAFDPELLAVGAILHDVGLVGDYDTGGCFEDDGARAAEAFARGRGWPEERCSTLAGVIRLHMAADLEPGWRPETRLLWQSTGTDVGGYRLDEIAPAVVDAVLAAYPRLGFKAGFGALFAGQAEAKPGCRAAVMQLNGIQNRIADAPFSS